MRVAIRIGSLILAYTVMSGANAQSPQVIMQQADREMAKIFMEAAYNYMRPLTDEKVVKCCGAVISKINKLKLDAFSDILSICSSDTDCTPQLKSYELKFQEPEEA